MPFLQNPETRKHPRHPDEGRQRFRAGAGGAGHGAEAAAGAAQDAAG